MCVHTKRGHQLQDCTARRDCVLHTSLHTPACLCTPLHTPLQAPADPCTCPCMHLHAPAHPYTHPCTPLHTAAHPPHTPAHPYTPLHTSLHTPLYTPLHNPAHPCTGASLHPEEPPASRGWQAFTGSQGCRRLHRVGYQSSVGASNGNRPWLTEGEEDSLRGTRGSHGQCGADE